MSAEAMRAERIELPASGLRRDLQAVRVVCHRELIGFARNKLRILIALVQPLLFLFVLGAGLTSVTKATLGDFSFRTFLFPGVCATAVLFPALFSAGSIVFDREFGFLREMLVAPIRRGSIVVGKCAGGALVAGIQGALVLVLAGLAGVPYDIPMFLAVFGELILMSFALVAFGVMLTAGITQFQSFQAVMQVVMFPLLFLSGTMFPLSGLPGWLTVITRLDPVAYAVDPIRRTVFATLHLPAHTREVLAPGLSWWGWRVPMGVELGIVALSGLLMLGIAIWRFDRIE